MGVSGEGAAIRYPSFFLLNLPPPPPPSLAEIQNFGLDEEQVSATLVSAVPR